MATSGLSHAQLGPCSLHGACSLRQQAAPLSHAAWLRLQVAVPRRRSARSAQPAAAQQQGLLGRVLGGGGGGAAAAPQQGLLGRLFGGGGSNGSGGAAAAARKQLLDQLASSRPDAAAVGAACDALIAARAPFREADLGGGPFVVVYTRGPLLWQLRAGGGGRLTRPGGSQASQAFEPRSRTVVNRGELLGPALAVEAEGVYEPVTSSSNSSAPGGSGSGGRQRGGGTCPVLVRASIEGGCLEAWGARLALPIRGSGLVEVAFADPALRIFRATNGSMSLQVRQSELARLLGARWAARQPEVPECAR